MGSALAWLLSITLQAVVVHTYLVQQHEPCQKITKCLKILSSLFRLLLPAGERHWRTLRLQGFGDCPVISRPATRRSNPSNILHSTHAGDSTSNNRGIWSIRAPPALPVRFLPRCQRFTSGIRAGRRDSRAVLLHLSTISRAVASVVQIHSCCLPGCRWLND